MSSITTSHTNKSDISSVLMSKYNPDIRMPSRIGASCFVPTKYRPIHSISGRIGSALPHKVQNIQSRFQMTPSNEKHLKQLRRHPSNPDIITQSLSIGIGVTVSGAVCQLDKGQDEFILGKTDKNFPYSMTLDGHGRKFFIEWFRSLTPETLDTVASSDNPVRALEQLLKDSNISTAGRIYGSGACISIVIMDLDESKIKIYYAGDVETHVYKNGIKCFQTELHDASNAAEKERLVSENPDVLFNPSTFTKSLPRRDESSNARILFYPGEYINHTSDRHNCLQMSRAIGHAKAGMDSLTGTNVGYDEIEYNETDELHIFSFSDGCGDVFAPNENLMLFTTPEDMVSFANTLWVSPIEGVHEAKCRCSRCRNGTRKEDENGELLYSFLHNAGMAPDDIVATIMHKKSH